MRAPRSVAAAACIGAAGDQAANLPEGIFAQSVDFRPGQRPALARQEAAEGQRADGDPLELMHFVAEMGKHPADFPIFPFVEHHLQHGTQLVLRLQMHMLGPSHALGQTDAPAEFFQGFRGGHARHLHHVFLLHSIAGMGQQICQFAVVGHEDQALAHAVEPADRKQPLFARYEVDHAWPSGGIEIGGHHAHRLVEHVDHPLGIGEAFPVDANFLPPGIDARTQKRDRLAIDFHAAGGDQFLAIPPAPQTG